MLAIMSMVERCLYPLSCLISSLDCDLTSPVLEIASVDDLSATFRLSLLWETDFIT